MKLAVVAGMQGYEETRQANERVCEADVPVLTELAEEIRAFSIVQCLEQASVPVHPATPSGVSDPGASDQATSWQQSRPSNGQGSGGASAEADEAGQGTSAAGISLSTEQTKQDNERLSQGDASMLAATEAHELAWRLRVAAAYNQMTAAKALLAARASVNQMAQHTVRGTRNALQEACLWDPRIDTVKMLLQARADLNLKCQYKGRGKTALQIAQAKNHDSIVQCLEQASVPVHPAAPSGVSDPDASGQATSWQQSRPSNGQGSGGASAEADEAGQGTSAAGNSLSSEQTYQDNERLSEGDRPSDGQDRVGASADILFPVQQHPTRSSELLGQQDWHRHHSTVVQTRGDRELSHHQQDDSGAGPRDHIRTVANEKVAFLQEYCSSRFRDGRTLEQTTGELKRGVIDPLRHPKFVLNGLEADVKFKGRWQTLIWTEDHRRLLCMKEAGCPLVRLRLRRCDDFMCKSIDRIGHHTTIKVRPSSRG